VADQDHACFFETGRVLRHGVAMAGSRSSLNGGPGVKISFKRERKLGRRVLQAGSSRSC